MNSVKDIQRAIADKYKGRLNVIARRCHMDRSTCGRLLKRNNPDFVKLLSVAEKAGVQVEIIVK